MNDIEITDAPRAEDENFVIEQTRSYLWVSEDHRGEGIATRLMTAAETEARARGCKHSHVSTFSFQALGFYERLGYKEFGRLQGFSGKYEQHFLYKALA